MIVQALHTDRMDKDKNFQLQNYINKPPIHVQTSTHITQQKLYEKGLQPIHSGFDKLEHSKQKVRDGTILHTRSLETH